MCAGGNCQHTITFCFLHPLASPLSHIFTKVYVAQKKSINILMFFFILTFFINKKETKIYFINFYITNRGSGGVQWGVLAQGQQRFPWQPATIHQSAACVDLQIDLHPPQQAVDGTLTQLMFLWSSFGFIFFCMRVCHAKISNWIPNVRRISLYNLQIMIWFYIGEYFVFCFFTTDVAFVRCRLSFGFYSSVVRCKNLIEKQQTSLSLK